jgi:hypothetical protein
MKYVLAVCTHNAGRSQMSAAFLERHRPLTFGPSQPATIRRPRSGRVSSRQCARSESISPTDVPRSSSSRCSGTLTGRSHSPVGTLDPMCRA